MYSKENEKEIVVKWYAYSGVIIYMAELAVDADLVLKLYLNFDKKNYGSKKFRIWLL